MDTKWKNTVKKMREFALKNQRIIGGAVPAAAGVYLLFNLIRYRGHHPTGEALFFGVLCNLFLGIGLNRLLGEYFKKKYDGWHPEDGTYFEKWKEINRVWSRRIMAAGIVAVIAAFWYLFYLTEGGVWMSSGVYANYASGYIMIFTALIQYIICRGAFDRFWKGKLQEMMESMNQINRKRLAEALEIERKSLEKVSRSDQLRVDLITNVSHDLKTPLTSMVGYIELIKKEELSDVVRDYVDVISERAEKLKEMINSLFNLAKASSGNVELHPEKFEVNRLIEQIFADMDDRIKESGLEFVTSLTEENTELVSDNGYFYRICQNLMENALKYSAKGTRVFVKTYVRYAEVSVRNTKGTAAADQDRGGQPGTGAANPAAAGAARLKNDLQKTERTLCLEITNTSGYPMDFTKEDIIERFARGDQARSGDGNGLGLAIVSTYAKALGGEFDIKIDCDQFKACLSFPVEDEAVEQRE